MIKKETMNQNPPLCAMGCGFFANPATQNLCSMCHRNSVEQDCVEQDQVSRNIVVVGQDNSNETDVVVVHDNIVVVGHENSNETDVVVGHENKKTDVEGGKKNKNKCNACKKRVGLTGFECRCGEIFCGSHRYPESHCCTFDHKGLGRLALSDALFAVAECKADKLKYRL